VLKFYNCGVKMNGLFSSWIQMAKSQGSFWFEESEGEHDDSME